MSQDSAAKRREAVITTSATAVHRQHRERIRAGVRACRAASAARAEHRKPVSSRLAPAEDNRPDRPLPADTAARHVPGGNNGGDQSWQ